MPVPLPAASLVVLALSSGTVDTTSTPAPATSTAQPTEEPRPPTFSLVGHRVGQGVGVETSALWPLFPGNLFQLRGALPVAFGGRGQLLLGAQAHAPHARPEEGRFSSLAAHVGWRGYLWKGLHAEALTNIGLGRLRGSVVDGKNYDSLDVEFMGLAGWRLEVGPLYVLVQPLGIAAVVYRSNPWAIQGEGRRTTEPPIYVGNITLGFQL
jgi:hypothetical protein